MKKRYATSKLDHIARKIRLERLKNAQSKRRGQVAMFENNWYWESQWIK